MRDIQLFEFDIQAAATKNSYIQEFSRCLDNGDFILGSAVADFEQNLSSCLHIDYIQSCGNGTDALWLAFKALGLKSGDVIALPAFSYIATAEIALSLDIEIIWYEINPSTYNIDETIIPFLDNHPSIKAVVSVHLFGQSGNIIQLLEYCQRRNILLIEDNAQSLGAKELSTGKYLGAIGDIGTTSFFPTKPLGCFGDGGAVFASNQNNYYLLKQLSNHGQLKKYEHDVVGMNSRLDTIQAAILTLRLKNIDKDASIRQSIATKYKTVLKDVEQILLPEESGYSTHVYHQYTIRVPKYRDALREYLKEVKIPTAIHYPKVIYHQPAYKHTAPNVPLRVSENLCKEVLSLPIHPFIDDEQIMYIASHIRQFFSNHV